MIKARAEKLQSVYRIILKEGRKRRLSTFFKFSLINIEKLKRWNGLLFKSGN